MATIPPVSDPRFDTNYNQSQEPKQKRSAWTTCLIGCFVTALIVLVIGAVVTFWIVRNFRGWAADLTSQVVDQQIDASQLPAEEKVEIKVQVKRVADAFRSGEMTNEQLQTIMQKIANSPLLPSLMVSAIDSAYLQKSGLSDDEKSAGKITLQRFLRGVVDKKINKQGIDAAMTHVANRQPDGQWQIRQNLTDAELRAFLDTANAEADKAGIEATPPDFDPSEEFKRIVDEAMNQPRGLEPPQIKIPEVEVNPPETKPLPDAGE